MQKLIVCSKYAVDYEINRRLIDGWSIVPGTTTIASVEQVRDRYSSKPETPTHTIFEIIISVVLEKGEKE